MTDQNLEQVSETETPSNEEKTNSYKNENQDDELFGCLFGFTERV